MLMVPNFHTEFLPGAKFEAVDLEADELFKALFAHHLEKQGSSRPTNKI